MTRANSDSFFREQKQSSLVKTKIVAKYFSAWSKIMLPRAATSGGRIAYIDLFSGQGSYDNGEQSTPLWILRHAIDTPPLATQLVTWFNDNNAVYIDRLRDEVLGLEGVERLAYQPIFTAYDVSEKIADYLKATRRVPTLFFIDPWGYKGLSLDLLGAAIRDWGCECIFFFNYNRISPGISNPSVASRMNDIFGINRAEELRNRVRGLTGSQREEIILRDVPQALREVGGEYVLPFRFKRPNGRRTSHHLIFMTKNIRGYDIMKDIMGGMSSTAPQGVPSFEFDPTAVQQSRFDLERPLDDLKIDLSREFSGQTLTMRDIYVRHNVGTKYVERNYKDALLQLEAEQGISVEPPAEQRRMQHGSRTFGPTVKVMFP